MMEEMKMADRSANQSAKDENNFQKQYITALPVGKDTVELSVSVLRIMSELIRKCRF